MAILLELILWAVVRMVEIYIEWLQQYVTIIHY